LFYVKEEIKHFYLVGYQAAQKDKYLSVSRRKPHSTSNHLIQEAEVMKHTTGTLAGGHTAF
jgi:hypothetical protein